MEMLIHCIRFSELFKLFVKLFFQDLEASINAHLIVCMDYRSHGIGFEGAIPWRNTQDMKHFKSTTSINNLHCKNILVCGRTTFDSIAKINGCYNNTLPGRHLIVISKSIFYNDKNQPLENDTFYNRIKMMFNFNFNIIYIVNNINERIIFTKNVIQNTFVVFIEKPEDVISAKKRIESYTNEYESEVFIIGGKTIYDSFMNGVSGIKLKSAVVTCLNYGGGLLPSIDYPKNTRFDTFFDYNFLNKIMRKVKYSYLGSDVKFSNFKKLNELFHSRLTDVIIQFKPKGLISRTFSLMN